MFICYKVYIKDQLQGFVAAESEPPSDVLALISARVDSSQAQPEYWKMQLLRYWESLCLDARHQYRLVVMKLVRAGHVLEQPFQDIVARVRDLVWKANFSHNISTEVIVEECLKAQLVCAPDFGGSGVL